MHFKKCEILEKQLRWWEESMCSSHLVAHVSGIKFHVASFIDATDQRPHWLMTNDHQIVALSFVFLFMVFHGSAKPHERRIASFWVRHVMLWSQPSMFSSRWICKLNLLTIRSPGNRLVWKKWFQEFYWYTYSFMLFCNCTMEPWYDFEHMRETMWDTYKRTWCKIIKNYTKKWQVLVWSWQAMYNVKSYNILSNLLAHSKSHQVGAQQGWLRPQMFGPTQKTARPVAGLQGQPGS